MVINICEIQVLLQVENAHLYVYVVSVLLHIYNVYPLQLIYKYARNKHVYTLGYTDICINT